MLLNNLWSFKRLFESSWRARGNIYPFHHARESSAARAVSARARARASVPGTNWHGGLMSQYEKTRNKKASKAGSNLG